MTCPPDGHERFEHNGLFVQPLATTWREGRWQKGRTDGRLLMGGILTDVISINKANYF
jgi:hypothetical protein